MSEEERFYLEKIGDSASRTMESIRASLSSRVNSFILVVSFVVLAEATISAALITQIFNVSINLSLRCICFFVVLGAFILIGFASYRIYKLFHANLLVSLHPESPEAPFLQPEIIEKRVTDFSSDEEDELFGTSIDLQGDRYSNIDFLYRRWVFQQVRALNSQYNLVPKLKHIFNTTAIFIVISAALLVVGTSTLAIGFMCF